MENKGHVPMSLKAFKQMEASDYLPPPQMIKTAAPSDQPSFLDDASELAI